MKANELRIGNFVNGIYTDNYGHLKMDEKSTICKVITLDNSDLCDYPIYVESDEGIEHFDEFEPIQLTEEWLLKFGFERNGKKLTFWKIDLVEDEEGIFSFDEARIYIDVKYVHQLQNLYFALTGEELTFKSE